MIPLTGGCDSLSDTCSGTGKVYLDTATYDPSDGIYSPLVPRENPIEPNPSSRVGGNASQNPQTTCNASDTYVSTGSANGVSGADMTAPTSLLEAKGTAIIPTNAPLGLHKVCADYSLSRMWDLILIVGGGGGSGSRLGVCGVGNAEGTGNIIYPGCVTRSGADPPQGQAAAYASGGSIKLYGAAFPNATYQVQFVPVGDATSCLAQVFAPDDPRNLGRVDGNPDFSLGPLPIPQPTATGTAKVCVVAVATPGSGVVVELSVVPGQAFQSSPDYACNPGRPDDYATPPANPAYFAGWQLTPPTTPGRVRADILEYSPYVANHSGDYVSAWTMLTDGTRYAQVGWWRQWDGARRIFWAWSDTTAPNGRFGYRTWPPLPLGTYTEYRTLYRNTAGEFSFQVNRSTVATITTNPTFVPTQAQIYGETHTLASQMPGGRTATEVFDDANISYWTGSPATYSAWAPFDGNALATTTEFSSRKVSAVRDEIGDTKCPL